MKMILNIQQARIPSQKLRDVHAKELALTGGYRGSGTRGMIELYVDTTLIFDF
jgi:hypothetical protein